MPHAWPPPEGWVRITSIDAHTTGEPLRVNTGAAYTTGKNEWWIDPDDPMGQGFILR